MQYGGNQADGWLPLQNRRYAVSLDHKDNLLLIDDVGKVCFACEVEGPEKEVLDSNLKSCPCCHAFSETTPKPLVHIATHILYDSTIDQSNEPCSLCLLPSPLCKFVLKKNKGSPAVDFTRSTCPQLMKFSYGPASSPSHTNPSGNVLIKYPWCPKDLSTIWKYNTDAHYHSKHLPVIPPPEFQITDFELEGLKQLWSTHQAANQVET